MLSSLHVHNFALIEDALIEFTTGFNVFTGETGAGKSILIDAFGIVLGNRASTDYIRSGADSYWVQATFDLSKQITVRKVLEEWGVKHIYGIPGGSINSLMDALLASSCCFVYSF